MNYPVYLYIAVMAIVTYLIRVLPLTLIKQEIKNPFIRSFLYYVPYVTLSVMTFPAIVYATASPVSGAAALIAALILAYKGKMSFPGFYCSLCSCVYIRIFRLISKRPQQRSGHINPIFRPRVFVYVLHTCSCSDQPNKNSLNTKLLTSMPHSVRARLLPSFFNRPLEISLAITSP